MFGTSGRGALNFGLSRCEGLQRGAPKVRSKELKLFNILRAYELKFESNLD